jgi:hypothetical protein
MVGMANRHSVLGHLVKHRNPPLTTELKSAPSAAKATGFLQRILQCC